MQARSKIRTWTGSAMFSFENGPDFTPAPVPKGERREKIVASTY